MIARGKHRKHGFYLLQCSLSLINLYQPAYQLVSTSLAADTNHSQSAYQPSRYTNQQNNIDQLINQHQPAHQSFSPSLPTSINQLTNQYQPGYQPISASIPIILTSLPSRIGQLTNHSQPVCLPFSSSLPTNTTTLTQVTSLQASTNLPTRTNLLMTGWSSCWLSPTLGLALRQVSPTLPMLPPTRAPGGTCRCIVDCLDWSPLKPFGALEASWRLAVRLCLRRMRCRHCYLRQINTQTGDGPSRPVGASWVYLVKHAGMEVTTLPTWILSRKSHSLQSRLRTIYKANVKPNWWNLTQREPIGNMKRFWRQGTDHGQPDLYSTALLHFINCKRIANGHFAVGNYGQSAHSNVNNDELNHCLHAVDVWWHSCIEAQSGVPPFYLWQILVDQPTIC